jgi:hypothetical protein
VDGFRGGDAYVFLLKQLLDMDHKKRLQNCQVRKDRAPITRVSNTFDAFWYEYW